MMDFELTSACIAEEAQKIGVNVSALQAEQLLIFAQLLLKWNKTYNLTALKYEKDVLELHLLDSLTVVQPLNKLSLGAERLLDVGSGGGLPAIPLAIMFPQASFTLVDAVKKKTIFLKTVCAELGLKNVSVIHARIEQISLPLFSAAMCRAFASLDKFVTLTERLVEDSGVWLAMKAKEDAAEIAALPERFAVDQDIPLQLPNRALQRRLIVIKKNNYIN